MSNSFWLRAVGDDAFADREDAKEDRKQLVALLSASTKELLLKHVELGRPLSVMAAERFCAVLEAVLLFGCREPSKGYYRVLAETLRTGVVDSIVKVRRRQQCSPHRDEELTRSTGEPSKS